ncbi:MAG TPA: NTP transferase domain-containing protein [Methylomirabilota bacterium]
MTASALRGGIIAAGEGSRLRADGFTVPKPMVPVAGVPLIEAVIGNFRAAGITSLVVIVNEDERACAEWLPARFPSLDLTCIVKTTPSSLRSFAEVVSAPGAGPMLVSTVDAWCPPADFVRFVDAARRHPASRSVLGLTPFVADEKPLRATLDAGGRITALGAGALVTAGLYLVSERVRALAPDARHDRLRDFLAWLVAEGEPLYGEVIPRVIDVDRAEDVALAEALSLTITREPSVAKKGL